MKNIYNKGIGCFTADFRNKKVVVGKKAFPIGHYFTSSLNEHWIDAPDGTKSDPKGNWLIANRIMATHFNMENTQNSIIAGRIDESSADKIYDSIKYIFDRIKREKPFCYLDLEYEKNRYELLFGKESVKRINHFLHERAQYTLQEDYFKLPDFTEIEQLADEQTHYYDYLTTIDYYYNIGVDMNAALDFGKGFVKQLPNLEKRDESHLILLAMDCIKNAPFIKRNKPFQKTLSPIVEYIAMPKKPKSKNFVVGKRMTFVRFLDFLVADFFEGLHVGHYPQLCENCKRYYLKTNARVQKYCTLPDPNDPSKRTCQAVAAAKGRAAKERHPLKYPYENRIKTIRTHVKRGKITEEQAAAAARVAKNCVDKALYDSVYANTKYKTEIGQEYIYKEAGIKF